MFGHLQVKSCYSFQNSTILIKQLVLDAYEKKIDALALTDKNNMYGAYEFFEECLLQFLFAQTRISNRPRNSKYHHHL